MAKQGELKKGDMVRYWARTPTASKDLDGYVGEVIAYPHMTAQHVYVRWLPCLCKTHTGTYGANLINLDKIDLLP